MLTAEQSPAAASVEAVDYGVAGVELQHDVRAVPDVGYSCVIRCLRVPQTIGAVDVRDAHQRGAVEHLRQLIERIVGAGLSLSGGDSRQLVAIAVKAYATRLMKPLHITSIKIHHIYLFICFSVIEKDSVSYNMKKNGISAVSRICFTCI